MLRESERAAVTLPSTVQIPYYFCRGGFDYVSASPFFTDNQKKQMDMNENKRLYRRKDGALASMSLEGGRWRLRTEDGRFTGYRLDGYDEIRDEDAANEEMEVLSCDYAIIKRQIWNLEGKVKGERARETMAKRDDVLASLYKRLDTVLSRMKMIIEVFW